MQVVLADVNQAAGREQAARLGGDFILANLIERQGCRQLVDETLRLHGTVHVLVNNAGYQHVSPIEDFPEDQWERMIALMLTAPFLLTRYCWARDEAAEMGPHRQHRLDPCPGRLALQGGLHRGQARPWWDSRAPPRWKAANPASP